MSRSPRRRSAPVALARVAPDSRPARPRRAALALLLGLVLLAPRADATWSIVVVDDATGEVAVAAATCLPNIDLKRFLPVIVVGKGAGAAQALIDLDVSARQLIRQELVAGTPPEEIIALLEQQISQPQSRQWGVAAPGEQPAAFTGSAAGEFKGELTGVDGTLRYSIQGNVLTGAPVLAAAERALLLSEGRLSDRLMAAMEAAMLMGGDGRCSCDPQEPTACGSPPASFEKSADVGFLIVSRVGDITGLCNQAVGCAAGEYWLALNVVAGASAPDPVLTLREGYDAFVRAKRQRADGVLSEAAWLGGDGSANGRVPADGSSTAVLRITLRDLEGRELGGAVPKISAQHHGTSAGLAERWSLEHLGGAHYELRVRAAEQPGTDVFVIRVEDHTGGAVLYPLPTLQHAAD